MINVSPGITPIGSLATINVGWNTLERTLATSEKLPARIAMARSLARASTARSIGSGPRMAVSRGSSESASQVATATKASTIIARVTKTSRSPTARTAVRPGDGNGMKRNFREMNTLRKRPSVSRPPQTMAMASW